MPPNYFRELTKLQHIDLCGCGQLKMLPTSFGNLINLQHIALSRCRKLQMLPSSFGNLISSCILTCLVAKDYRCSKILSGRENIEAVPPQLEYLRFLQRLHLDFEFKELPSALGNLSNLEILELRSSCLELLPPSFGDLRNLKELTLAYCPFKFLCDSIRMLTQLEMLNIEGIKVLKCYFQLPLCRVAFHFLSAGLCIQSCLL